MLRAVDRHYSASVLPHNVGDGFGFALVSVAPTIFMLAFNTCEEKFLMKTKGYEFLKPYFLPNSIIPAICWKEQKHIIAGAFPVSLGSLINIRLQKAQNSAMWKFSSVFPLSVLLRTFLPSRTIRFCAR
jgi:hypothetical protein